MCLEGCTFTMDRLGFGAASACSEGVSFMAGGKPVAWVEYGISAVGVSGPGSGLPMVRDGEAMGPTAEKPDEMAEYQSMFHRIFNFTGVKGSLPWFYPGGFRFTQHSGCGHGNIAGTGLAASDRAGGIIVTVNGKEAASLTKSIPFLQSGEILCPLAEDGVICLRIRAKDRADVGVPFRLTVRRTD